MVSKRTGAQRDCVAGAVWLPRPLAAHREDSWPARYAGAANIERLRAALSQGARRFGRQCLWL